MLLLGIFQILRWTINTWQHVESNNVACYMLPIVALVYGRL
jgi:hypothetical protein